MKTIGFIGCGKMASALAIGGVRAGVLHGEDLLFSDVHGPSAEALADGGVLMGLPRETALKLAAQTLMGAARMILEGGSPGPLKDAVASPGGTTIAGLEVLEVNAVRGALMRAVRAAAERSAAMGG